MQAEKCNVLYEQPVSMIKSHFSEPALCTLQQVKIQLQKAILQ